MSIEKLQAENARLKTEVEHLMVFCNSTLIPSKELQADNARLKAEVERLKAYNEEALAHIAKEERKSRECLDMEQAENARLKAEVERLRASSFVTAVPVEQYERVVKAGDAMYQFFLWVEKNKSEEVEKTMDEWEAAKEGKQP